ncbi:MAG: hypothetical protein JXA99_02300 [Candidatus Lokiarchaeota archaeon]|nr:hypothetical protein [Candidatus Lokiarchaeota archaeon]
MLINKEKKEEFLSNFQNNVIHGRKLLQLGNHHWASKVFLDLYFDIETKEWLDAQKKHQLILIISNSWWMYLNSLKIKNKTEGLDYIKYIDAYQRFFSYLSKLEDFSLFDKFASDLLKSFISIKDLSTEGISKFLNSYSVKVIEQNNTLKLIELQLLLMFLRKTVIPTDYFKLAMESMGRIIYKLEPGKRSLFLYIILENVNIKFNLLESSEDFIKAMNKILVNRIPNYLKNDFSNLSRISINERSFNAIQQDLVNLIEYLNNVGEASWIIIVIRSLFKNIKQFQSLGDAIVQIRQFINYTIDRNKFDISYEIYDFLEDLFLVQSDLSYDNVLIELWAEACSKFVNMREKKFLLQSIEKLSDNLKIPQNGPQIYHYFYTSNYLWKFKSMFFYSDKQDFWRMLFYRALYEENNIDLAKRILPLLHERLQPLLNNLELLYKETSDLNKNIYILEEKNSYNLKNIDFEIKNIILRINSQGELSYRILSTDNKTLEGKIIDEFWNDIHLMELYNDIYSDKKERLYDFTLSELGAILYLSLPKNIRNFFSQFKIRSLEFIPQIYYIIDTITIPFELVYDGNFFFLKYSCGYNIGEPPIHGINFEEEKLIEIDKEENLKYDILIIDSTNSLGPIRWNEDIKNKELLFPFPAGNNELVFISNYFNQCKEVNTIEILSGRESQKQKILDSIRDNSYKIIYIVGNIFYSNMNPRNSYFIANDNDIIKFTEIFGSILENKNKTKPVLFFNTQIYNIIGDRIKDDLRCFGEIISNFDLSAITGIISRVYPIFNEETKQIIADIFQNLFEQNSIGISLLKARQKYIADRTTQLIEQNITSLDEIKNNTHINIENSLSISSFILYGEPWRKL